MTEHPLGLGQNCWVTERRVLFVMSGHFGNEQPSVLNFRHFVAQLPRQLSHLQTQGICGFPTPKAQQILQGELFQANEFLQILIWNNPWEILILVPSGIHRFYVCDILLANRGSILEYRSIRHVLLSLKELSLKTVCSPRFEFSKL